MGIHVFELLPFLQNLAVGALGLFGTMYITVFFVRRIALNYEITARVRLNKNKFDSAMSAFFMAVTYLMLLQILGIVLWALAIHGIGLIDDPLEAVLFVGSCYTTIGIVSDVMPMNWKLLAIFIALSGLFAVALATASMMNMSILFRQAWMRKHAEKISSVLKQEGISIPEFVSVEETIKLTAEFKKSDTKSKP